MKENVGWTTNDEILFINGMFERNRQNPRDLSAVLTGYITGMKLRTDFGSIDGARCISHAESYLSDNAKVAA